MKRIKKNRKKKNTELLNQKIIKVKLNVLYFQLYQLRMIKDKGDTIKNEKVQQSKVFPAEIYVFILNNK